MKKLIFTTIFLSFIVTTLFAQVGIGTTSPNASSVLDLTSTTKAFLPPRMTTTLRDQIANPVAGMVIYNTTTNCIELYRGSGWYNMCTGSVTTPPTITSFTPSSGSIGTSVTITGTNLTGGTVKLNGTSASTSSVTATSITFTVPGGATSGKISVTTGDGTATSATDFTVTAGVLTSNDVATSSLIAHWTFDTDSKETGSGTAATTSVGASYVAGKIGNALSLSSGYLLYPSIFNISQDTAFKSYSISMWANIPSGNTGILRPLFQVTGNRFPDLWGNVAFELTNNGVPGDTLPLQVRQVQVDGTSPYVHNQSRGSNVGGATNRWVFLTQTYDGNGTNQTMKIFADGIMVDSAQLTTVDKSVTSTQTTFRVIPTGGSPTPTPNNKVYIGTAAFFDRGNNAGDGYGNFAPNAVDRPWAAGSLTGKIDDIRVFNRPLTKTEITDLYTRGSAGN